MLNEYKGKPPLWDLKDWDWTQRNPCPDIISLKLTPIGYHLKLSKAYNYRQFILTDNGGELNFMELVPFGKGSMELPIHGTPDQTNIECVFYRIFAFINNEPIDYDKSICKTQNNRSK